MPNLQTTIVQRIFESKGLREAEFQANGSTYKCVFGKYYRDGESITRDDYFDAKAKADGATGASSTETPKDPKPASNDFFSDSKFTSAEDFSARAEEAGSKMKSGKNGPYFYAGKNLEDFDATVSTMVGDFSYNYKGAKTVNTSDSQTVTYDPESGHAIVVKKDGAKSWVQYKKLTDKDKAILAKQSGTDSAPNKEEPKKSDTSAKTDIKDVQITYKSGGSANMDYLKIYSEKGDKLVFKNLMYTNKDNKYLTADKSTGVVTDGAGNVYGSLKIKKSASTPPARGDYFDAGNFYRVGRSGDFEKDMKFIRDTETGVTAELVYGNKDREYVRKVGPDKWQSDSGKTYSDNDVASVAYDGGKTSINYMVKNKPTAPAKKTAERKTSVPNPESPKKLNSNKVSKISASAVDSLNGTHFEDDVYEFNKGMKSKDIALSMSNELRKQGYKTQFWTASGKATDNVTDYFSVVDPKDSYRSLDYKIYPDTENSSDGKVYFHIESEDVY